MSNHKKVVGVLGLQGAVQEHVNQIQSLDQQALIVKKPQQLSEIDALIIPGGESTTMRNLIDRYGFFEPLKSFSLQDQKPILGTCAGMVLMAKKIVGSDSHHLGLMDINVKRNAFGRQRDSFEVDLEVKGVEGKFPSVFIRAPYIESIGEEVEVLATFDGHIVAARQGNLFVSSFHPELTADNRFLKRCLSLPEICRI